MRIAPVCKQQQKIYFSPSAPGKLQFKCMGITDELAFIV
jgi:hypothetical protein